MKPSKDLDEQINEILANLYNSGWVEGSNYKENNPEGSEIPSQSEIKKTKYAKQQLLALVEQREREARIDKLLHLDDESIGTDWKANAWFSVSDRIAELKKELDDE